MTDNLIAIAAKILPDFYTLHALVETYLMVLKIILGNTQRKNRN